MSDSDAKDIQALLQEGLCCSQAIVTMGLRLRDEENPSMVAAASGLCQGMYAGEACGCITSAAQVLALVGGPRNAPLMIPQLLEWYDQISREKFSGQTCMEITGGVLRPDICMPLVVETWQAVREILAEFGFES
ncbi:MAG: hypothetical protein BCS36_12010 [Desulfovibrio sp. MES5]|uniref:C-GCAxxG-C-C family protein n=1 Tax=Desulfovibrio sp. MES5 TaxID=1899016 RepID=UPI000B9CC5B0|nr:C-GCAxxG-C-C family protein [Desulfovibrio sp. MES5]OXS30307.1 MAG: hypothetical protein BCS36_12010 [Desulfovibrio sp. MES5]